MNKLFTKIVGAALGLTMAIGVGVAVASSREAVPVHAAETSDGSGGYYDTFATGTYDTDHITWSMASGNITLTQLQGSSGTAVSSSYTAAARVYKGHILHFNAATGYAIKKIEITYSTSYKGNSMTAGVAVSDNTVTDNTTAVSRTWATANGGTHEISAVSSSGLSDIYIQNVASATNTQLRWASGGVKVYYTKPSSTGSITGVEINGSSDPLVTTVSSGYLGRKTVQLTGVATQSGSGLDTSVTWSSANSSKMTVNSTGLVTILANDTVRITATSVEDDDYSNYIDITATGLATFTGTTTSTNFDTTDMGSSGIQSSASGTPADISGVMTVATLTTDKASSSSNPGFYTSNPVGVRIYTGATMTVTVPSQYKLYWVDLTSLAGNELTTTNTSVDNGTLSYVDTASTVDLTGGVYNSTTFTMTAQVRLSAISVSYGPKALSTVRIDDASTSNEFLKDSTVTAAMVEAQGISAFAVYEGGVEVNVTSSATWTLDTSTEGTAYLYATYGGTTSDGVLVTIAGSVVPATGISVSPDESTLFVGDTVELTATVTPAGATDKSVSWESDDDTVATVDENGVVTAIGVGETYITVTANGGTDVQDIALITVQQFSYSKATNINGGDRIIFTYESETINKYMNGISTTSTKYGTVVTYESKPDLSDAMIFDVVAGSVDGSVAFKNGDNYLYWTSGNSLNVNSTLSANTSWNVSFTDGVASIVNVSTLEANDQRYIGYNTGSPRFACYTSDYANVIIWKLNGSAGQSNAETWATAFYSDVVNAVCKPNDSSFSTNMPTAWATKAATYAALGQEAKSYIASKNPNASGDVVEKALYEYNHIYSTYGSTLSLENFIGRIEPVRAARVTNPVSSLNIISNNSVTIIIIVSLVSLTAIGGYFFIRKRKEQ